MISQWRVLTAEDHERAMSAQVIAEDGNKVVAINEATGEQMGEPLIVSNSPWVRHVAFEEAGFVLC